MAYTTLRLRDYTIRYSPGKDNGSDWLSRHPDKHKADDDDRTRIVDEDYINFVIDNTVPKSMTAAEIRDATNADHTLQQIIKHVELNDWWCNSTADESIKPYFHVRDKLSVSPEGILLRGTRIVIPCLLYT